MLLLAYLARHAHNTLPSPTHTTATGSFALHPTLSLVDPPHARDHTLHTLHLSPRTKPPTSLTYSFSHSASRLSRARHSLHTVSLPHSRRTPTHRHHAAPFTRFSTSNLVLHTLPARPRTQPPELVHHTTAEPYQHPRSLPSTLKLLLTPLLTHGAQSHDTHHLPHLTPSTPLASPLKLQVLKLQTSDSYHARGFYGR